MVGLKTGLVTFALLLGFSSTGTSGCGAKRDASAQKTQPTNAGRKQPTPSATPSPTPAQIKETVKSGEINDLSHGAYGRVEEPFVAVVRDAETYNALRQVVTDMEMLNADFFKSNAVVAGFLGTRNTGGYSLEITRVADGHLILTEKTPPRDAITTQAMTQVFKVISVPVSDDESLQLELPEKLVSNMRSFKVTPSEFTSGGGFAGRLETLQLGGTIGLMWYGKLLTLFFDLKEVGGNGRVLKTAVTGLMKEGKQFSVASTDAGTLVQMPHSPLRVEGSLNKDETVLTLNFVSLSPRISDGYTGGGKLEATRKK